jgi:Arc/MetJ-type ribon-helix-helix transcriptional regulator
VATYLQLNRKYLKEADDLVAKGDYAQASEKLWGAFVEIIKAVAESRGEKLGTHRSIAQYVLKLDKENPELRLHDAFAHADKLHTNFYEDHLPSEDVLRSEQLLKRAIQGINEAFLTTEL